MVQNTGECFNCLAFCLVLRSYNTEISKTAEDLSNFAHILILTVDNSNYFTAKTAVSSYRTPHSEETAVLTPS